MTIVIVNGIIISIFTIMVVIREVPPRREKKKNNSLPPGLICTAQGKMTPITREHIVDCGYKCRAHVLHVRIKSKLTANAIPATQLKIHTKRRHMSSMIMNLYFWASHCKHKFVRISLTCRSTYENHCKYHWLPQMQKVRTSDSSRAVNLKPCFAQERDGAHDKEIKCSVQTIERR